MDRKYLGDSYDLVKRFFGQVLHRVAPLYAHDRFIPRAIRQEFSTITGIPILEKGQVGDMGVHLDPSTGIPLNPNAPLTTSHAPIAFIAETAKKSTYLICFDQSHHRKHELSPEGQRARKRELLSQRGILSFYYRSHAPFLFAARDSRILGELRTISIAAGIPECRFER